MTEELDRTLGSEKGFKTYVVNFHFVFYGYERYYTIVNCAVKDEYKTKYVTDVAGLPEHIDALITNIRRYVQNMAASGRFNLCNSNDNNSRESDAYLAVEDRNNQFSNALEVWNLVMAYYHLVEARIQLMECNYQLFQNYVNGPYIKYIGSATN